jgi:hypothetical protein
MTAPAGRWTKQEELKMGQIRDADIAAWQQHAGLKEATGERAQILQDMSNAAFSLIKIIELERSGIRDGDGYWSGCDVLGEALNDLITLMRRLATPGVPLRDGTKISLVGTLATAAEADEAFDYNLF